MANSRRRKIHVTSEDIAKGKRYNCRLCAVSLAALRSFKGQDLITSVWGIRLTDGMIDYRGKNQEERDRLSNFIYAFDEGRPVKPTTFEIVKWED